MTKKPKLSIVPDVKDDGYEQMTLSDETKDLVAALVLTANKEIGEDLYMEIGRDTIDYIGDRFDKAGIQRHSHYLAAMMLHLGDTYLTDVVAKKVKVEK